MMGNFLTTLGNEPEEDRAMFEELGLNVARQPDNAANPRPDNRSGWLAGETPDVVEERCSAPRRARRSPAATLAAERIGRAPVGPVDAAALSREARGPAAPRRRTEPRARGQARTRAAAGPRGRRCASPVGAG